MPRALEALGDAARMLREAGLEEPEKEAELLVTEGLGIGRVALFRDDPRLEAAQEEKLKGIIARRAAREPAHYILGGLEFYGMRIRVARGVLIPRPETELLAGEAVRLLGDVERPRFLELCTGSGAVALAVAKNLPGSTGIATDISQKAIELARENAGLNSITAVEFCLGSLLEPVRGMSFHAMMANPPYVRSAEIETLAPEIRDYEPREALDGGPEGLDFIREIIKDAPKHLLPGAGLLLEVGHGQARAAADIARAAGVLKPVRTVRDHAGHERIIVLLMR